MLHHADTAKRRVVYRRLAVRNRVVGLLRMLVPIMGMVVLAGILGQIFISSLADRFSIDQISVTRDMVNVMAPTYTGVLDDGTAYHVSARIAMASAKATDLVDLKETRLVMTRPDGLIMTIETSEARLEMIKETVIIPGLAYISNSLGTRGTIENSIFDYAGQVLTGQGAVDIFYADGTHLVANGMRYDVRETIWTFDRAWVTLPRMPGAETLP